MGLTDILVKIPAWSFGSKVSTCSVDIDCREGDLDRQLTVICSVKRQGAAQRAPVDYRSITHCARAVHEQVPGDGTGKFGAEIDFAQLGPAGDDAVAFHRVVIDKAELGLDDVITAAPAIIGLAAKGGVVEVKNDLLRLPLGEGIAVDASTGSSAELGFYSAFPK